MGNTHKIRPPIRMDTRFGADRRTTEKYNKTKQNSFYLLQFLLFVDGGL